jgi:hypothetical protein
LNRLEKRLLARFPVGCDRHSWAERELPPAHGLLRALASNRRDPGTTRMPAAGNTSLHARQRLAWRWGWIITRTFKLADERISHSQVTGPCAVARSSDRGTFRLPRSNGEFVAGDRAGRGTRSACTFGAAS